MGQAIGDEAARNQVLAQVENWIKTIRDRVTNEDNPDFVVVDNPIAEANNAINLMLNNFGRIYLRSHPDYLADALFTGLPQGWWDKPLAEMDAMKMADRSGEHTVSPSTHGLLMNFETPVQMWHDDVLFNPSDLLGVRGAFLDKATFVPLNEKRSIILNSNNGEIRLATGLGAFSTAHSYDATTKAYVDAIVDAIKYYADWCGNLARVGASGTWLGIPTGYQAAALQMGTGAAPDTSYTTSTTADDLVNVMWIVPADITILTCEV